MQEPGAALPELMRMENSIITAPIAHTITILIWKTMPPASPLIKQEKYGWNSYGLTSFDGSSWTVYNKENSLLEDNHIEDVAVDKEGTVWAALDHGGLASVDKNNKMTVYTSSNSDIPDNRLECVYIDQTDLSGRYFKEWDGIFDGTTWNVYDKSNSGLLSDQVMDIFMDEQGTMWINSYDGLTLFNEQGIPEEIIALQK